MKAFVSWSGGKESVFSLYKARQNPDINVVSLLNMVSEDGRHSRSHGIGSGLLRLQAEALGIPLIQRKTSWQDYEQEFKNVLTEFKKEGINTGIFGDIDFAAHREWGERVCGESGIKPLFPLWQRQREHLLKEFIEAGFETLVVATMADLMDSGWLGRRIDKEFVKDLKELGGVDLSGEAGEYHTFVVAGPGFQKKINILKTEKAKRNKHWYLGVLDYEIIPKI